MEKQAWICKKDCGNGNYDSEALEFESRSWLDDEWQDKFDAYLERNNIKLSLCGNCAGEHE